MSNKSEIALDFGTATCLFLDRDSREILLYEPTVVAISTKTKKVLEVGQQAKEMLGKEPEDVVARRPLINGGISNFQLASVLLKSFFDKVYDKKRYYRPSVTVSIPAKISSIEERALIKSLEAIGVKEIKMFPESMAAARGAELDVESKKGQLLVNLGGGTAEIAVFASGGIVTSRSHVGVGDLFNQSISTYLRSKYDVDAGQLLSEEIKVRIGSAIKEDEPKRYTFTASDVTGKEARQISIDSNEVSEALKAALSELVETIESVLANTSAALVSDIVESGIALTGGSSLLRNLDVYLTKSLNIPCYVVSNPESCVVRGL